VLTTLPDRGAADALGRSLVEARLAACVSVGAPVQSIYHWRASIETSPEVPLSIKTRADLFDAVAAAIRATHPYELPEILAVPICDATSDYLAWIDAETRPR
jgi:periplasmic divalent cation tolerance protein